MIVTGGKKIKWQVDGEKIIRVSNQRWYNVELTQWLVIILLKSLTLLLIYLSGILINHRRDSRMCAVALKRTKTRINSDCVTKRCLEIEGFFCTFCTSLWTNNRKFSFKFYHIWFSIQSSLAMHILLNSRQNWTSVSSG